MSAAHTPGRLKVQHPHAGERGFELAFEPGLEQVCQDITEANARRLAACWNVCQGATTEQLERSKDLTSFVLAAQEIERQKTALYNAAKRLADRGFFDVSPMTQSEALEDLEMMRKAIEKATTK